MTPNFPIINLILNTLNEFSEREFAFEFSESLRISTDDEFLRPTDEDIKQKVQHFDSLFELAENEITQTIFAANPIIINSLFDYIKTQRNRIYPKAEVLFEEIRAWNTESYKDYENKIEQKSARYFSNDKFIGLKHLDAFSEYVPESPFNFQNFKQVTSTYYAFYCIEDEWKEHFDLAYFDNYYSFLAEQIDKLAQLFDKYIRRYDAGEFTNKDQKETKEDTLQENLTKRAQNNKIIVGIIILGIVITFIVAQWENLQKIMGWVNPKGKELSGIVTDKAKNGLSGVSVIFGEHGFKRDSTDSFGKFQFADLRGEGMQSEIVQLKRSGYRDTSFVVKINYDSEEKLERVEIVLNVKSDLDFCIEGDVQACYRYANSIAQTCPPNEGQARTACIFKAEMWRAVGDDYQDVLNFKRDSGETSNAYKEALRIWKHQIEMSNAMPDW